MEERNPEYWNIGAPTEASSQDSLVYYRLSAFHLENMNLEILTLGPPSENSRWGGLLREGTWLNIFNFLLLEESLCPL